MARSPCAPCVGGDPHPVVALLALLRSRACVEFAPPAGAFCGDAQPRVLPDSNRGPAPRDTGARAGAARRVSPSARRVIEGAGWRMLGTAGIVMFASSVTAWVLLRRVSMGFAI